LRNHATNKLGLYYFLLALATNEIAL
jgi:hypothetical protein